MEASRRSKRKPLSDCTNIVQNHRKKPPPSSSSSKNPNSTTLIKPPKPPNVTPTTISSKIIPPTSSSQKSQTSIGSNNSSKSVTVPSIPHSPEPPAHPTPLSDSGDIDRRVSGLSADQSRRDDEARRKEKGKMVADTPIIPLSVYMTSKPLQIASSSATGQHSRSGIQAVHSQKLHAQPIKDKGKNTVKASVIQLPAPLISKHLEVSSSTISGSSLSGSPVVRSQELHEERRKDEGKMVLETPNMEESEPSTPHAPLASPATSGDRDRKVSGLSANQSQRDDEARRKEKGKMVADTSIIPLSVYMTSKPLQIASSSGTGHYSHSGIQAVHSQKLHAQTIKDKGNTTVKASAIQLPAPLISKRLEVSSSTISGSSLYGSPIVRSQELHEERSKDEGKTVLETPNIEESEPSTPHASLASPVTSGTRDKPVTIYSQRRGRQGRKRAVGKNNLSSSYSEQRIRKTGLEFDDDRGHKKGSHTDPLPVHKKKQSRNKHGGSVHVMPQEEVDKLRAYYADLDAFELPEEVASESDLE